MKKNELRIGNIIADYANRIVIVSGIEHFEDKELGLNSMVFVTVYENHSKYMLDDIHSIPLTEEWLIKFGFSDKDYKTGYIGINVNHMNFVLTKPGGEYDFEHYSWEYKNDRWPKYNEFKYVHELQNFFFALTNEELEIK